MIFAIGYLITIAVAFVVYVVMRVVTDSARNASASDWILIILWPVWILAAAAITIGLCIKAKTSSSPAEGK